MFADSSIAADRCYMGLRRPKAPMGMGKASSRAAATQAYNPQFADCQQAGYQDPWTSQNMHTQGYAPWNVQWYQPVPVVMTAGYPTMQIPEAPSSNPPSPQLATSVPPSAPVQPMWASGEPVSVEVMGLPSALCTNGFMEAMLEQAGLEHTVLGYEVKPNGPSGHATIRLCTPEAAAACVAHFHGHRCAQGRGVMVAYVAESGDTSKKDSSGDTWEHAASGRSEGTTSCGEAEDTGSDNTSDTNEDTPDVKEPLKSSPRLSSIPSELRLPPLTGTPTSTSKKPRWADLDDDGDEEEDSTSAGTPSGFDDLGDSPFSSTYSTSSRESSFTEGNFS